MRISDWSSDVCSSDLPGDRELGLKGHIEHRLLPMLAALGETPVLAGYCLGGLIAAATCELMDVSGLVIIAAPWHFAAFPQQSREKIIGLWEKAPPVCERQIGRASGRERGGQYVL